MTFAQLGELGKEKPSEGAPLIPYRLQAPRGKERTVRNWADLIFLTAEWLIEEKLLTKDISAFAVGKMTSRYLINVRPEHPNGKRFKNIKQLSNGLYLECQMGSKLIARRCGPLVEKFGEDPAQFDVWLR